MQYANFESASQNVSSEIERLYDYEYISRAEADAIDVYRVQKFIKTDLFERILKADKLYREQRFMLSVKAGDLYENLSDAIKDRDIIVQGAVDCMFVENDSIVLIDFKTDRTNDEEFLLQHYSEQLKTYCYAAQKMFCMPVSECYIYSLHMNKKIAVKI
jgi:ATP-dependent helicase/nuclease subunit A